jgi:hypothetical protein
MPSTPPRVSTSSVPTKSHWLQFKFPSQQTYRPSGLPSWVGLLFACKSVLCASGEFCLSSRKLTELSTERKDIFPIQSGSTILQHPKGLVWRSQGGL